MPQIEFRLTESELLTSIAEGFRTKIRMEYADLLTDENADVWVPWPDIDVVPQIPHDRITITLDWPEAFLDLDLNEFLQGLEENRAIHVGRG